MRASTKEGKEKPYGAFYREADRQRSHKETGVDRAGQGGDCAREWVGSAEVKSRK
jgi:hypothetical protein